MSTFLQDSMLKEDIKHSLVKLGMLLVHMTYPMRYFWRFKLATMLDAADWYFQALNIAVLHVMTDDVHSWSIIRLRGDCRKGFIQLLLDNVIEGI